MSTADKMLIVFVERFSELIHLYDRSVECAGRQFELANDVVCI